jgi:type II secretory ATPase GspE/PulE/Tfp pilus assembly ATPase PilB-like protein
MIISRKSIAAISKTVMNEGMKTLLQCGVVRIINGETDLNEVLSVCIW